MRTIVLSLFLALISPIVASAQDTTAPADPCATSHEGHSTCNDNDSATTSDSDSHMGFRLRLKAAVGVHARDLHEGKKFLDSGDVGLMIEPFHFHRATVNGFVSFRSVGIGLGHDVTDHFGIAALANTPWDCWRPSPFLAAYFMF